MKKRTLKYIYEILSLKKESLEMDLALAGFGDLSYRNQIESDLADIEVVIEEVKSSMQH